MLVLPSVSSEGLRQLQKHDSSKPERDDAAIGSRLTSKMKKQNASTALLHMT